MGGVGEKEVNSPRSSPVNCSIYVDFACRSRSGVTDICLPDICSPGNHPRRHLPPLVRITAYSYGVNVIWLELGPYGLGLVFGLLRTEFVLRLRSKLRFGL